MASLLDVFEPGDYVLFATLVMIITAIASYALIGGGVLLIVIGVALVRGERSKSP
jgi:hypothetical protein